MIVGNDVSEFQGQIDWNVYKNNSNFIIIRATFGNGYFDKWFTHNRDEARRVGLPRGYYHYAYPQYNTPEIEADWFCKALWDIQEEESLYLDYEENWNGNVVSWCKAFLDRIAGKLNGYKAFIYLNQSLATSYDWTPVVSAGYGLWIAAYTYDPNNNNFKIGPWPLAAIQQWTNKQQVPGIQGAVDGDVFFGDINTFKKYGYIKPQPSPQPTEPAPQPAPNSPAGETNYKEFLVQIKGVAYGKGWPWQKLARVKEILTKAGV